MFFPPTGTRQIVSKMKWAWLATPLLLLGLVEGRQVEVEDVTARQLEAATQTEDVLAVFWCKYALNKAPETRHLIVYRVFCTDKKQNKIFLIYKEIQKGAVAKS
jgi:hypothetical protein